MLTFSVLFYPPKTSAGFPKKKITHVADLQIFNLLITALPPPLRRNSLAVILLAWPLNQHRINLCCCGIPNAFITTVVVVY